MLKLPFPLLSDFPKREVSKTYDALITEPPEFAGLSKRAYFIIDKNGILRWKKILENPRNLVPNEELLAALQRIQEGK